jgi:hypothetical protein
MAPTDNFLRPDFCSPVIGIPTKLNDIWGLEPNHSGDHLFGQTGTCAKRQYPTGQVSRDRNRAIRTCSCSLVPRLIRIATVTGAIARPKLRSTSLQGRIRPTDSNVIIHMDDLPRLSGQQIGDSSE